MPPRFEHVTADPNDKTSVSFARINELVRDNVLTSKEYLRKRNHGYSHPEAFHDIALLAADNQEAPLRDAERDLLRVVANLGRFIQAHHELNTLRSTPHLSEAGKEESTRLKREIVIPFNSTLKNFINSHPNERLGATASALAATYEAYFSRHDCLTNEAAEPLFVIPNSEASKTLRTTLNGMRHELAAETMLMAAGYDVRFNTTVEDDASGTDLFVFIDNTRVPLDIKASETAVEEARAKYRYSRAVWTGLTREDFTGMNGQAFDALSVSYGVASEKSTTFVERINEMRERIKKQQLRARRAMAKKAVSSRQA